MELPKLGSEGARRWAEIARHPVANAQERVRHARTRVAEVRQRIADAGTRVLSRRRRKPPEEPKAREPAAKEAALQAAAAQPEFDVQRERLLREVETELASLPHVDVHDAVIAVICTLTARLSGGEALDLLRSLPLSIRSELAPCERRADEPGAAFGREEFLRKIAEHAHASERNAERIALAVFRALRARLPVPDAEDVDSQLPADLKALWRAATPLAPAPIRSGATAADHPLLRDIERSGALPAMLSAAQAFAAVMCTLLTRLPDDASAAKLANGLPLSVRELVTRCPAHRGAGPAPAEDAGVAEFVRRVAEHLNVDLDTGEDITRAVFAAVQPVLSDAERDEVARELPDDDLRRLWREPELHA